LPFSQACNSFFFFQLRAVLQHAAFGFVLVDAMDHNAAPFREFLHVTRLHLHAEALLFLFDR